jgi:hypothetical protein
MSELTLTVGECCDERRSNQCISHIQELGLNPDVSCFRSQERGLNKKFLLLNLATVGVFLDYSASLVSKSTNELISDPAFMNLPFWQESFWIPQDFAPAKAFEEDDDGPFFFGSNLQLLLTLDFIKSVSRIPLGPVPPAYDLMVRDLRSFYREFKGIDGEQGCIQWVWRGLYDGATLAVQNKLPMAGNGL